MNRLKANPLLSPDDVKPTRGDLEVLCTLNPAAVRFNGEIILLVRVGEKACDREGSVAVLQYDVCCDNLKVHHISKDDDDLDCSDPRKFCYRGKTLLTSMSHLRIARSIDGEHFRFDDEAAIFPATAYEGFGCEDARITCIEGTYYITYTAVSQFGVAVAMASTKDFTDFRRHGIIFPPYQKDVCLFPRKVNGRYVCRHRPYRSEFNDACIWTARSDDLESWGSHEVTLAPLPGTWESERVGAGPPPIETPEGWLDIYHAADSEGRYALGAMLSELDHPERVISRSTKPILQPEMEYERAGVYGNVVFANGMLADDDGTLTIYYGAADTICAAAVTSVDEMLAAAKC